MQTVKGSYHNLAALAEGGPPSANPASAPSPSSDGGLRGRGSLQSRFNADASGSSRVIIVSNHLPLRTKRGAAGWEFEWDEDALVAQAKDGIPTELDVLYVGTLPIEASPEEEELISATLKEKFGCVPVFFESSELKDKYYKGFCKQQLWPLFHYILPVSPLSSGRFDIELWQAYVKANMAFADALVEEVNVENDAVWIHDYHLLVLPSLLRKRFNRIRCGVFLHSPFPSSEIFRTFPKREELLRSLLNADLIGFHTFDYARHFLSCCSRMLGLEHETSRGSITLDYYGRTVGLKIMPTGVNPQRYINGFEWDEFKWRRGELAAQFAGKTVMIGVDDMDIFKGIELKLLAFERLLELHAEWRGKLLLVQITNPPRSSGKDVTELHQYVRDIVERVNKRFGSETHQPVYYLERHVPLHERMAFYSEADVAVVTATRDGMNLVPYEYIVCRQGAGLDDNTQRGSMLVVSEFVGCSPSLSGAIRVNPWSVDSVSDGMYSAIRTPLEHRRLRHEKHWKYVSNHTVAYWAQSYIGDLQRVTKNHATMKCYGLGLGLDTYRMVALDANFRRLQEDVVCRAYEASRLRVFFLDYDGTLTTSRSGLPHSSSSATSLLTLEPSGQVLTVLQALAADPRNVVCVFSGRPRDELASWFTTVPSLFLVAENGYYFRAASTGAWETLVPHADFSWKKMALPILQTYAESTDGSFIETKDSALVWNYRDADPDFGSWQAKELLDHLEGVLSNKPVDIVGSNCQVEIKPQGVSKGQAVERMLAACSAGSTSTFGGAAPSAAAAAAAAVAAGVGAGAGTARGAGPQGASAAAGAAAASPSGRPQASGTTAAAAASGSPATPAAPPGSPAAGPDFILCIGDDRSDEEMFITLEGVRSTPSMVVEVFECTVGQKPSRAPFYLNDPQEVLGLMARLVGVQITLDS